MRRRGVPARCDAGPGYRLHRRAPRRVAGVVSAPRLKCWLDRFVGVAFTGPSARPAPMLRWPRCLKNRQRAVEFRPRDTI